MTSLLSAIVILPVVVTVVPPLTVPTPQKAKLYQVVASHVVLQLVVLPFDTKYHTMKRKTIEDFFDPAARRPRLPRPGNAPTKNGDNEYQVPGLLLHLNFVSETEEQAILGFLNDNERCKWRTDLNRRTMHFGGTYCLMPPKQDASTGVKRSKSEVIQAPPMPNELYWLIQRFVEKGIFSDKQRPQYCIVNEYVGAQGIAAHTENFRFDEPIVGLSLLRDCPIRFHELTKPFDGSVRSGKAGEAERTGRRMDVPLPRRSLLVMRGPSRWQWQHEIVRSEKGRGVGQKRVSLTFRHDGQASPR